MPRGKHADGSPNRGGGRPAKRADTRGQDVRALRAQNAENTRSPRHNAAVVEGRAIQAEIKAAARRQSGG